MVEFSQEENRMKAKQITNPINPWTFSKIPRDSYNNPQVSFSHNTQTPSEKERNRGKSFSYSYNPPSDGHLHYGRSRSHSESETPFNLMESLTSFWHVRPADDLSDEGSTTRSRANSTDDWKVVGSPPQNHGFPGYLNERNSDEDLSSNFQDLSFNTFTYDHSWQHEPEISESSSIYHNVYEEGSNSSQSDYEESKMFALSWSPPNTESLSRNRSSSFGSYDGAVFSPSEIYGSEQMDPGYFSSHEYYGGVIYTPSNKLSGGMDLIEKYSEEPEFEYLDPYSQQTRRKALKTKEAKVKRRPVFKVEFKKGRSDIFDVDDPVMEFNIGDFVMVEADRGKDLGKIVGITDSDIRDLKLILSLATPMEISQIPLKEQDEFKALQLCQAKIKQKKLLMEVVEAEYQYDRKKLIFFFVADRRIDFRELVRELFKIYKTRIWMCAIEDIRQKK